MDLPIRNPYPRQLIVDIHSFCNARCVICPYPELKSKLPLGIMEEALFRKIIDEFGNIANEHNFKGSILFCNMGELFFYPELAYERMRYVMQAGLDFNIQTNAAMLSPDAVDRLIDMGFNGGIVISFHGITPAVYKQIMGLDVIKTLNNIDYLSRNYPKGRICIQSIPHNWPLGEARRIRRYFHSKGLRVRMPLPNNRAGLVTKIGLVDKHKLIGCKADRPLGEMVISFNGDVVLCCNDMAQKEVVGNLENNTILEIWNGRVMMNKLEQIYCGKSSPDDFICKKCEFAITSHSSIMRIARNIRHECRKLFLTRIW